MKEEDIDKIFRQELQHSESPVSESDWKNFQRLQRRTGTPWWKILLPLLLVVFLISGAAYLYFTDASRTSENQSPVGKNTTIEKTLIENPKSHENVSNSQEVLTGNNEETESDVYSDGDSLFQEKNVPLEIENTTGQERDYPQSENSNIRPQNPDAVREDIHHSPGEKGVEMDQSHESFQAKADRRTHEDDLSDKLPESVERGEEISGQDDFGRAESYSDDSKTSISFDSNPGGAIFPISPSQPGDPAKESFENNISSQPQLMVSRAAGVLPVSKDDHNFIAEPGPVVIRKNNHQIGLYFGVEQNNILGISPMAGVVSSWHLESWKLGIGLGYQRSGALNWQQESKRTVYGFDRYEAIATLQTHSVDLISMPFIVSRQLSGTSSIFMGFTPSVLVHARQELSISDDSNLTHLIPESRYVYHTQAPDIIYFISGGYTHYLATWWGVDVGVNYTFQEWKMTNKVPVGAFIRTHIRIK